jgi:DNA adenine methylase
LIPYSEVEFEAAVYGEDASDIEKAVCDFVKWRQSFGGQGKTWGFTKDRSRGGKADNVNGWLSSIEMLQETSERLLRVQILCRPAVEVIQYFDNADALIYCDPPYVHSTRSKGATSIYAHEMTDVDHRELARVLRQCKARVALSGYRSGLYSELFWDWRRVEFDMPNHAAGGKEKGRETEVLWMNWRDSGPAIQERSLFE